MKTPDEIKRGLEYCPKYEDCTLEGCECPYFMNIMCSSDLMHDALAYINELEARTCLNTQRDAIYKDAVAHGLRDKTDDPIGCSFLVSEKATELVNAGNEVQLARWRFSDDEKEAWGNYVEELADVIITSLYVAGCLGIDIDAEVRRKIEINKGRPWKHGKDEQGKS